MSAVGFFPFTPVTGGVALPERIGQVAFLPLYRVFVLDGLVDLAAGGCWGHYEWVWGYWRAFRRAYHKGAS